MFCPFTGKYVEGISNIVIHFVACFAVRMLREWVDWGKRYGSELCRCDTVCRNSAVPSGYPLTC